MAGGYKGGRGGVLCVPVFQQFLGYSSASMKDGARSDSILCFIVWLIRVLMPPLACRGFAVILDGGGKRGEGEGGGGEGS